MVALYGATLFISALLLFLVQPMVGKMVLPKLGGTPAVWNTCMVFFQAMLLAGYAYAHGTVAWLNVRRQARLHLLVLAAPLLVLPITVAAQSAPPSSDAPLGWLLWQLFIGVGLPFFVLASSAPLLQKWFAQTSHGEARDPYFLYAASNTGSLLALLGYPLLVEPHLRLDRQSGLWAAGYGFLAAMVLICAVAMWRSRTSVTAASEPPDPTPAPCPAPRAGERLWWILLSAIPSSLMLGVTTFITTDLAAIPLVWVLPLAIYLLTFVLVFARRPLVPQRLLVKVLPFLLLPMAIFFAAVSGKMCWIVLPIELLAFFVIAMICHGELVRRRPAAERLTEFYLLMSLGGVIGGIFNAIVAPHLFVRVIEYPLVVVLACLVVPRLDSRPDEPGDRRADLVIPAVLACVAAVAITILHATGADRSGALGPAFVVLVAICFACKNRPVRFGLNYAVAVASLMVLADLQTGNLLHAERNFFGVKRVYLNPDTQLRTLVHGTTTHGCQKAGPTDPPQPSSYYHRTGPIGDLLAVLDQRRQNARVGVIGLGVGAVAAYARPGEQFTFYEIDPAVERIARDPRYFTFLSGSRGRCEVVLGDGRLTIARAPDRHYDLLLLDAFSSDAIPMHLLSREALELYVSKLAKDGTLAFHISNRFFKLEPLLARSADELGLSCLARFDARIEPQEAADGKMASHYFIMAPLPGSIAALASRPGWHQPACGRNMRMWTDQYFDIFDVLFSGKRIDLSPKAANAGQ